MTDESGVTDDSIEIPCDGPGDRSCWGAFTVRIDHGDMDEFAVYPWGELREGRVVRTFEEGVERFGPLEDRIDALRPDPERVPSPPEWWLQDHRSVGIMAQRSRASVIHPAVDPELRYPAYQLVAVCRAVEHSSVLEEVADFDQTETDLSVDVTLRSEPDAAAEETKSALRALTIALITQPRPPHSDHPLCDCIELRVRSGGKNVGYAELDGDVVADGLTSERRFRINDVARAWNVCERC